MTRLASPLWLGLGLLIILRVALLLYDRRRRLGAFDFSSLALVSPRAGVRRRLASLPFVLECVGLVLLIVAMARPQKIVRTAASDRYGIDIVIALDGSGSMAAEDFQPRNRFAMAKELIGQFINRRTDDRIGIITFGGRAATRVPITYDRIVALAILNKARLAENGEGTAIGQAIATAVNRLHTSKARTRVIILVTDGVNNSGSVEPMTAAQVAAREGIKIYTIGVGSRGKVPMPSRLQDPVTGEIVTVYDVVRGDLDEKTLQSIAQITGGEYFRATDTRAMSDILRRIDALEKSRLTAPKSESIEELYSYPLSGALAALSLAFLLGETLWQKVSA